MSLTAHHAKLFAHELTKRSNSDNVDKLASALSDAQVDLNPHQIEAALFAFRSPLSRGAILADEVGLGKTIDRGSPRKLDVNRIAWLYWLCGACQRV
jgi:SNF2 family DNA or RNA helicase